MLGVVCGLEQEAAIARRANRVDVVCAGSRPHLARDLARALVERGATALVSFGIAGALKPGLGVGAVVIGSQVRAKDGAWTCDEALSERLSERIPAAQIGAVWGAETIVPTAAGKRELFEASGCLIVDMESHCAAEIAAEAGLPFAVLRTVCDTSTMELPPVVFDAIDEDGRVAVARALASIARRPGQIAGLFGLAAGTGAAVRALRRHVRALEA